LIIQFAFKGDAKLDAWVGFPGIGTWSLSTGGNGLSLVYSPDLYTIWSDGIPWNGMDSSPNADPDKDGIENLMEYGLGGNPLLSNTNVFPALSNSANRLHLTFIRIADPALRYDVIASGNLGNGSWQQVWTSFGAQNIAGSVTVDDSALISEATRRFLRLKISR
jgi:hypothetical protein